MAAAKHFDVIVIGSGAAGMMCAATAGQRGRRVLIIDHATKLAEKIRCMVFPKFWRLQGMLAKLNDGLGQTMPE